MQAGDRVVRVDGRNFSNGERVATIERIVGDIVWLNTGRNITRRRLRLVYEIPDVVLDEAILGIRRAETDIQDEADIEIQDAHTAYILLQSHCGIKEGDRVEVLWKADSYQWGWANSWNSIEMDDAIGRQFIVGDITSTGIYLEGTRCRFPFYVLRKVEE